VECATLCVLIAIGMEGRRMAQPCWILSCSSTAFTFYLAAKMWKGGQ
jgi:hypothetical protein